MSDRTGVRSDASATAILAACARICRCALALWLLLLALPGQAATAGVGLEYELRYSTADPSAVLVCIRVPGAVAGPRRFSFPRAVPMGYGEQPFDRYVRNLRASSDSGRPLPVRRSDGPHWVVGEAGTRISGLEYEVAVADMERGILSAADTSKIRPGYVGLLGYTVFGYLEGTEGEPIRMSVIAPAGWPVFSTLAPDSPARQGRLSARAADFYALADSQVLLGPEMVVSRIDAGVPLFLAAYAEGRADLRGLAAEVSEAFAAVAAYFGSIPFKHYSVCQEYLHPVSEQHEYGFSMEHLESGTFFFAADQALTESSTEADRTRVRYNLAHHIAHAWIPKRCYGEGYFPFNWERAPQIDTIWFSEGFPQYAAIEALADTMPPAQGAAFREGMIESRFRSTLRTAPDFIRKMSLIDLSRLASTRYSEDFRIGRSVFSRGGMMALEMDEKIRRDTGARRRLRDALRYLVAWSARSGRAFKIDEIPEIFARGTGADTRDILARWLPALAP
jgi:predicted metalloprotease with PDZ domain